MKKIFLALVMFSATVFASGFFSGGAGGGGGPETDPLSLYLDGTKTMTGDVELGAQAIGYTGATTSVTNKTAGAGGAFALLTQDSDATDSNNLAIHASGAAQPPPTTGLQDFNTGFSTGTFIGNFAVGSFAGITGTTDSGLSGNTDVRLIGASAADSVGATGSAIHWKLDVDDDDSGGGDYDSTGTMNFNAAANGLPSIGKVYIEFDMKVTNDTLAWTIDDAYTFKMKLGAKSVGLDMGLDGTGSVSSTLPVGAVDGFSTVTGTGYKHFVATFEGSGATSLEVPAESKRSTAPGTFVSATDLIFEWIVIGFSGDDIADTPEVFVDNLQITAFNYTTGSWVNFGFNALTSEWEMLGETFDTGVEYPLSIGNSPTNKQLTFLTTGETQVNTSFVPRFNNTQDLGSATKNWGTVYSGQITGTSEVRLLGGKTWILNASGIQHAGIGMSLDMNDNDIKNIKTMDLFNNGSGNGERYFISVSPEPTGVLRIAQTSTDPNRLLLEGDSPANDVGYILCGVGASITAGNFECLNMGWDQSASEYVFDMTIGGTGVAKDMVFQQAGADYLRFDVSAASVLSSVNLQVSRIQSGGIVNADITNTSNTIGSDARLRIGVAGNTAGDPFIYFQGFGEATIGMDNSDADIVKFGHSSTVGSETALQYNAALDVTIPGGSLILTDETQTITADAQVVTPGKSTVHIDSDNATATMRTFTLTTGAAGELLTLIFISATNAAELVDTGTACLSGDWLPTQDDSLSLIYSVTRGCWIETARSTN